MAVILWAINSPLSMLTRWLDVPPGALLIGLAWDLLKAEFHNDPVPERPSEQVQIQNQQLPRNQTFDFTSGCYHHPLGVKEWSKMICRVGRDATGFDPWRAACSLLTVTQHCSKAMFF